MDAHPSARLFHPGSWPVAARLAVSLALASLVPLAISLWFSVSRSRTSLELAAEDHLQVLAAATADRLDQMISESVRTARALASDGDLLAFLGSSDGSGRGPLFDEAMRTLAVVVESNPHLASAFVINADAFGVASTNPRNIGQDLSFREYTRRALEGQPFVSQWIVGSTSGEPGVYCSAPVVAADGDGEVVIGAVVVKIRGEALWRLLESVSLPPETTATLVDQHGVLIAHPMREFLYHSLGPLSAEQLREIDPKSVYNLDSIESVGLPQMLGPATDQTRRGAVTFLIPVEHRQPGLSLRRIAAYSAMAQRPWKVIVAQSQERADAAATALVRQMTVIAGVVSLAAVGVALVRSRSIVRPIRDLSEAAEKLGTGDFTARAPKHADDEIGRLADAFNRMAPRLQDAVSLKQSLAVAMEVQQSLLPACNPRIAGLDIAGRTRYCDETGGDYYDFLDVSSPHPGAALVAVGDVMGHGIGAALLMASARAALRTGAIDHRDLASLLNRVNAVLVNDRDFRFMTLALLLIDPARRVARWASAGHDPTIVYTPGSDGFDEFKGGGIPLGIEPSMVYEEFQRDGVASGQVMVVGTDGIWEAPGPGGDMFGKDRLREVIRSSHAEPAAAIARAIEAAVDAFRGPTAQKDDITFVVIKVA